MISKSARLSFSQANFNAALSSAEDESGGSIDKSSPNNFFSVIAGDIFELRMAMMCLSVKVCRSSGRCVIKYAGVPQQYCAVAVISLAV